ncbi:hypothetical protein [Pediococcus inopinatus]
MKFGRLILKRSFGLTTTADVLNDIRRQE